MNRSNISDPVARARERREGMKKPPGSGSYVHFHFSNVLRFRDPWREGIESRPLDYRRRRRRHSLQSTVITATVASTYIPGPMDFVTPESKKRVEEMKNNKKEPLSDIIMGDKKPRSLPGQKSQIEF